MIRKKGTLYQKYTYVEFFYSVGSRNFILPPFRKKRKHFYKIKKQLF